MGTADNAEIIEVEIDTFVDGPKRGAANHPNYERQIHVPGCVPGEIVKVILFDEGPHLMGFPIKLLAVQPDEDVTLGEMLIKDSNWRSQARPEGHLFDDVDLPPSSVMGFALGRPCMELRF